MFLAAVSLREASSTVLLHAIYIVKQVERIFYNHPTLGFSLHSPLDRVGSPTTCFVIPCRRRAGVTHMQVPAQRNLQRELTHVLNHGAFLWLISCHAAYVALTHVPPLRSRAGLNSLKRPEFRRGRYKNSQSRLMKLGRELPL